MRYQIIGLVIGFVFCAAAARAADEGLPAHLADRGPGIPTSMFGTYIEPGEFFVYVFFEHYRDKNYEYAPNDFGVNLDRDFRGSYRASEELLFLGYGVSDRLVLELEGAIIQASLEKDPNDTTGVPDRIEESGIGDVEGQLRFRWSPETATRPELFSYMEVVMPTQDEGSLIGTTDWEFKFGSGVVRGFRWGTVTGRAAVAYDNAESAWELGEAALEYLKRLSPTFSLYGGIEGTQDEVELITELQVRMGRSVTLKANSGFGLTSKATDWAPEVGLLFRL